MPVMVLNIVHAMSAIWRRQNYDKPGLYQIKISLFPARLHGAGDRRYRPIA